MRKLKLNGKAVATTSAILGAVFFLACYVLVVFAPNIYRDIAQSWAHGVDLSLVWRPRTGNFLVGFVSFTGISWITGWAFAALYNKLNK